MNEIDSKGYSRKATFFFLPLLFCKWVLSLALVEISEDLGPLLVLPRHTAHFQSQNSLPSVFKYPGHGNNQNTELLSILESLPFQQGSTSGH